MAYAEKPTLFHSKICCYCDQLVGFLEVGAFLFRDLGCFMELDKYIESALRSVLKNPIVSLNKENKGQIKK
jgi:hypothetical protein